MRIKIFSDLHLEFRNNLFDHIHEPHPDDGITTLCLSGDISTGMGAREFVEEMCKHFKHVLMICGNHEYYHNDFLKVNEDWKKYEETEAPKNFHFLYNDWRILDGVRFLGATMWTSFGDGEPMHMATAHRIMADYQEIRCNGERITPHFILREHDKAMDFLVAKFDEPFEGKTVVMSHHSPGNELKRKGHRMDRAGVCYFADIEELVGYHDCVDLWTHGHTHRNWDYMINNTRVICNPYGYWGYSTNADFDRSLIVEI